MICDGSSCPEKYINEQICYCCSYDTDEDDFVRSIKHEKCKVIQLVRRQMRKLNDAQYNLSSSLNGWQISRLQELKDTPYRKMQSANVTEKGNKEISTTPGTVFMDISTMPPRQAWILRTLRKIRQRVCMIILIAGIITLMVAIYGIYFRAYLCNSGKSCVTTFRYTHAKHALF
ncbi:hypothetical protein ANTQUA_LOCUS7625 [Anthophora quadrimaculata]